MPIASSFARRARLSASMPAASAAAKRSRSLALCAGSCPQAWRFRNGAPFKDWLLPANLERVRRRLRGSDDGDRQMVAILSAVLTDGLSAVEAACMQALSDGVHSSDIILNILARSRDPVPSATIMTPDALRLHHAPVADCNRYDRLRRTC